MKKIGFNIFFIGILAGGLFAKDCPSRLYSNLHQVGNSPISFALEMRGFDYYVGNENFLFYGLGGLVRFEPADSFSLDIEGVYRPKKHIPCDREEDFSPFQLKVLVMNLYVENLSLDLKAGRQEIRLGNGLILNDFFDAIAMDFELGDFDLSLGAGTIALQAAKESLYCQKCAFYEYKSCWKGFCNAEYGDHKILFANITKNWKGNNKLGLLYVRSFSVDEAYVFDMLSLNSRWRMPLKINLNAEFAVQRFSQVSDWAYGMHFQLYRSWRFKKLGNLTVKIDNLYGSSDGKVLFSPIFGNIYFGERQHYSVRQGATSGINLKFTPHALKFITLNTFYYLNSDSYFSEGRTDEFGLGVDLKLGDDEKYRLLTMYSHALTPDGYVNQIRFEMRISL